MGCGLVLDRLIGGAPGGGGGRVRTRGEGDRDLPAAEVASCQRERRERTAREEIAEYSALFHLDNGSFVEKVFANYQRIYGGRKERSGREKGGAFRKTEYKHRVAMAFSLCNVMAKEGTPRPVTYITELCQVDSVQPLLDLKKSLNLSKLERDGMEQSDFELTSPTPQDYVDVLCAYLGVPFKVAGDIRTMVEKVEWLLYGRHPTVITAAVTHHVLRNLGWLTPQLSAHICLHLNVHLRAVKSAMAELNLRTTSA